MIRRMLSAFLTLALIVLGLRGTAAEKRCDPAFSGTFLQSWYCADWDDARWMQETEYMRQTGIDKLILQDVACRDADGVWTVWYPSALPEFDGCGKSADVIGAALRACGQRGIRLFVGLASFDNWWVRGALTGEYMTVCGVMTRMQQEIYDLYHGAYGDTFYGWYFSPEISNVPTMKASILTIARGLSAVLDNATRLDDRMPVMLSPYFTEYLAVPSVLATLPMWQLLLRSAHFRDGDIFCPQDAIGAQWIREKDLEKVWNMYALAVEGCPAALCLWANCETMIVARKSVPFMPPKTTETENMPVALDRLIRQMQTAANYCACIVSFSFAHYYSPLTGNPAYFDSYLYYVSHGFVPEKNAPSPPSDVCLQDGILLWNDAADDVGVAYYLITRNGKPFCRVERPQANRCAVLPGHGYALIAVDGAGNRSEPAPAVET